MKTDTKILLGAIGASVLILTTATMALGKDQSPKREELGTAAMTIDKLSEDFGNMRVDEEKTATFTFTNTSTASLRIWNVNTSCNCTFATVTIGDKSYGEFNMSMHMGKDLRNWIGEIGAGQTATLAVVYKPKIMPVTGPVTRQARFATNDPNNPEVEVSVSANVL